MKDISIESINIDDIKPYENNPRHNDDAVKVKKRRKEHEREQEI